MKDKEKQNISMKEMLTKRSIEPITNCNCRQDKDGAFVDLLNQEIKELHKEKRKQITEMAKHGCYDGCASGLRKFCDEYDGKPCKNMVRIASGLYEQGYRKLPEDSVVLTREEYEKLKNESIDKLFADDTFFKEEFKANKEYLRKRANRDYIKLVKKQTSKETAEKIYKDLKLLVPDNALGIVTRYFKDIIGVEIKE